MNDPTPFDDSMFEPDIDYDIPANMPEGQAEALERASWHLRMAAKATQERDELAAVYEAEFARLRERLEHRRRILDAQIRWHEAPVEQLHLALVKADPKRKTIELPYGTSRVRVSKTPRVEIVDRATLLAWCEQNHPDVLGRTINVTGVKEIVARFPKLEPGESHEVTDSNGELIPGAVAVMPEPSWSASYDSGES